MACVMLMYHLPARPAQTNTSWSPDTGAVAYNMHIVGARTIVELLQKYQSSIYGFEQRGLITIIVFRNSHSCVQSCSLGYLQCHVSANVVIDSRNAETDALSPPAWHTGAAEDP